MVEPRPESFHAIEGDGVNTTQDESPEQHVGAFLREARENTGRTVEDVTTTLRIGAKFLKSIEDGRFDDLPGPTYATGFIRSYADYLGLDSDALVAQFKSQSSGAEQQSELEFSDTDDGRLGSHRKSRCDLCPFSSRRFCWLVCDPK